MQQKKISKNTASKKEKQREDSRVIASAARQAARAQGKRITTLVFTTESI